jgi:uncharacterized protein (DUF433 family)
MNRGVGPAAAIGLKSKLDLCARELMATQTLDQHIESNPDIAGGKPRIAGHRITVQNIAIWHERMGKTPDEIAAEYDLTLADVYAALAYYFDNREEIERSIAEDEDFVGSLRAKTPSKLLSRLQTQMRL